VAASICFRAGCTGHLHFDQVNRTRKALPKPYPVTKTRGLSPRFLSVSDSRWAARSIRCGGYGHRPRLAPKRLTKTRGPSRVFVSDKRPKFTAKARSSPSLRTSQEAPGADQPNLNRKKAGTVPGFCFMCHLSSSKAQFRLTRSQRRGT
jgi:hypothetical protein